MTLPGGLFIALIAVVTVWILFYFTGNQLILSAFGGTSGTRYDQGVALDTMSKLLRAS